jgi:hypothetical protein
MLNVIMVSVAFYLCYADGRSAERLITIDLLKVTHRVNIVHYCSGLMKNMKMVKFLVKPLTNLSLKSENFKGYIFFNILIIKFCH